MPKTHLFLGLISSCKIRLFSKICLSRLIASSNDLPCFSNNCIHNPCMVHVAFLYLKTSENIPAGNYMFKFNNRNTKTRGVICSDCKICPCRRSDLFIINFQHISHLVIVFLLSTWVLGYE